MMKKVSSEFIFTLESTASTSCWAVVSVEYFLPRFPIFFVEEEFRMLPFITPPRASEGRFRKGFCFFLPFSANISMACFFDKFLSCCCNKSASSLNISLDCCVGQLRAAKMLYLLKYVMSLLVWSNKSPVCSIYALIISKSMGICFHWIHVPLPLTSTVLTESPSHRHSWTELFQMCYPCPSLFGSGLIFLRCNLESATQRPVSTSCL